MVNLNSFVDEFMRIKVAEEQERKLQGPSMGRLLGNLGIGAAAYGLGAGTAGLVSRKVLPKALPHLGQKQIKALSVGAGLMAAAGGLAFADAMRQNKELLSDSFKRDK